MDFLTMMHQLFNLQSKFPEMEVIAHDGYLTVNLYVGIENTDLFKQGQQMFEPL